MDGNDHVQFLVLCVVSLCFLHANQDDVDQPRDTTLLSCTLRCLDSPSCGWIIWNKTSRRCYANDSIDCLKLSNALPFKSLVTYGRLPFEKDVKKNMSSSLFKRMDDANVCTTMMISCDTPRSVANAVVGYDTLFPGSTARYSCYEGFSFCGIVKKEVKCQVNGSWENIDAGCYQDTWRTKPNSNELLRCPVGVGFAIEIIGVATDYTYLIFSLLATKTEVVFFFKVDFSDKIFLCNWLITEGQLQKEIITNTLPFQVDREFNITISVNVLEYDITVDGKNFTSFGHRYPLEQIVSFSISGSFDMTSMKLKF